MQNPVVIIGGGPGGAALGCYLSMAGISNIIFEAAIFPRAHVGESMVTATTRIFEEIGFLKTMEQEGFIHKYGASWHPSIAKASVYVEFAELPQAGITQKYTYQVDRSRFDALLLKHAEGLGSKVYQGARVKQVLFEGEQAVGVQVEFAGQLLTVPACLVVDASGRNVVLGSQLKIKKNDPVFNQFAVHAWFENVERGKRPDDIHIHFLPTKRAWVWQIPITEKITSVGVVTEKATFRTGKEDFASFFQTHSHSAPDIAHAMRHAHRINDFTVEADYSYQMDNFVGNGWMLVGDAARFVDPIFSSGVSVAMHSAKFAAAQIKQALSLNDVSKDSLLPYETQLKQGVSVWYEFIQLYYKLMPIFSMFIAKPEYRLQIIQLLQGDVYNRDSVPVLHAMRHFIDTVENTEGHLLRPYLDGSIKLDAQVLATAV